MAKMILPILLFFLAVSSYGQSKGDSKIIVTVSDTSEMYNKVRVALIKNDFIVKEDGNRDTLSTYSRELKTMAGNAMIWAVIKGNDVELSGIYSLKKLNYFGFTKPGRNSNTILYFRGSKTWKLLEKVAETIGGQLQFAK